MVVVIVGKETGSAGGWSENWYITFLKNMRNKYFILFDPTIFSKERS